MRQLHSGKEKGICAGQAEIPWIGAKMSKSRIFVNDESGF